MKRAICSFLITLICVIQLTSCSNNTNEPNPLIDTEQDQLQDMNEDIVLTVLTNRVDLIENGGFQKYADEFKLTHPQVTIQFEGLTNYVSDISVRLSTQNFGDVLLIPNHLKNEVLPNYFTPLPDEMFQNIRFSDYKTYNSKRYGIAAGAASTGIVYNKEAFKAAGITSIPTTLDEFYEACHKLKMAGITPIYLNYGAQWPLMNWGEELVSIMKGDAAYLNDMIGLDEPWQVDNEWGQAITIVKTLIENDYVEKSLISNQWEASKLELAAGRAGMYFMGNWVINQLIALGADPETIGFFPFPYSNEKPLYSPLNPDWFVGVSKYSEHTDIAIEWIEYFIHESGFVDDSGFLPVDTTKVPTLPQFQEFESYGSIPVERMIPSDRLLELASTAKITLWSGSYIQEWIVAPSLQEVFEQYNKRWTEARTIITHQ